MLAYTFYAFMHSKFQKVYKYNCDNYRHRKSNRYLDDDDCEGEI